MPTSNFDKIPATVKAVEVAAPGSILDIGIGFGKYGALFREKLDIANENFSRDDWKVVIDGVEAFEEYRSPLWDCYNEVHIGNIKELLPNLGEYDVATVLDVIEHFPKEEGHELLSQLLTRCDVVIVTTPVEWHAQVDWGGNELERHHSLWGELDFKRYESVSMIIGDNCLMAILAKSEERRRRFTLPKYPVCSRRIPQSVFWRLKKKLGLHG